jgi:hypothetical protein
VAVKYDLGDLFAIFPDLPWNRTATTAASRGLRRASIADSVRLTRANATIARTRFTRAVARYAAAAAARRAAIRRRRRR